MAAPEEVLQDSSCSISSKINLTVKNVDGCLVFFKISKTAELEKLMDSYCIRESKKENTVVFKYNGRILRRDQTPLELKMEDGDEICAYDVEYLMRMFKSNSSESHGGVQEGVNGQFDPVLEQERRDDYSCYSESLDGYSFDELMQEATQNFMQAVSYVKASVQTANQLTAESRKLLADDDDMEPMSSEEFYGNIAAEKMLDGGQIQKELSQANAKILDLSRKQSQLEEALVNVKKKLMKCNEYRARLCEEVEGTGGATMEESHNDPNRTHLHAPTSANQSPVQDEAVPSNMTHREEMEQPTDYMEDINDSISATMNESYNEPKTTHLHAPISANQSPMQDDAAPSNMTHKEETEQPEDHVEDINDSISATMDESYNEPKSTHLHAPISANQSPMQDDAAPSNMTYKEEKEQPEDHVEDINESISATMEESYNEPKRTHLHAPISANQSPVQDDVAPSNMMQKEENEQPTDHAEDINISINATMEEPHSKPNRTHPHVPISPKAPNQSPVQDDAAPSNMMHKEENEQPTDHAEDINISISATMEESPNEPNRTHLHAPISANQSPAQNDAAPSNTQEDEQPRDHAEHINLRIIGQTGTPVALKTFKNTPLRNVMQAYCVQERKDLESIRFLFNGCLLQEDQTPDELQMGDGSEIKAELKQSGGV